MDQTTVVGLALSGFNLETGLDDVAGGGKVGGWHTGHCASCEQLEDPELLGRGFTEEVAFEVVVGREIDGGEWDVTEETSGGTLVETDETEVLDDPEGRSAGDAFDIFSNFSLDLETNLDDF